MLTCTLHGERYCMIALHSEIVASRQRARKPWKTTGLYGGSNNFPQSRMPNAYQLKIARV
eukprot:scaffold2857_cov344-Pavlova_lutheri.AAC.15